MKKKAKINMILTIFGGWLGIHKFARGNIKMGVIYFFTLGIFCIGWIYDMCIAVANYIRTPDDIYISPTVISDNPITTTPPEMIYTKDFDNMEGHEFEYYCADLLKKNGFSDVKVTRGSGDQGIDILAYKDDIKYGIQCKCYSKDIGNRAVQEAFAGKTYYNCHIAVVLTNRYFTKAAKELSEANGVLLWDRDKLESFIECTHT